MTHSPDFISSTQVQNRDTREFFHDLDGIHGNLLPDCGVWAATDMCMNPHDIQTVLGDKCFDFIDKLVPDPERRWWPTHVGLVCATTTLTWIKSKYTGPPSKKLTEFSDLL